MSDRLTWRDIAVATEHYERRQEIVAAYGKCWPGEPASPPTVASPMERLRDVVMSGMAGLGMSPSLALLRMRRDREGRR